MSQWTALLLIVVLLVLDKHIMAWISLHKAKSAEKTAEHERERPVSKLNVPTVDNATGNAVEVLVKEDRTMYELKPCPFCGGKAIIVRNRCGHSSEPTTILDDFSARCESCGVWVGRYTSKIWLDNDGQLHNDRNGALLAAMAWNKRAHAEPPKEEA